MTKLMITSMAALSLFSVTGCNKKKGGAAAEAIAKMEGFSKDMCECKDKACADKVNDAMAKWGTEMAKTAGAAKDEKPDPELAKKSADVMTKYTECMTKLMMAGAGDTKGSGDAAGDKGSAATATTKTEEAKTCSATAWKQSAGLFCVDAPGFIAGKEEPYNDGDGLRIYFKKEAADGKPEMMFNVTWLLKGDPKADAITSAANMENDLKNNTSEGQGAFAGGKGRFFVFARKDNDKSHKLYAVVQGNKHAYQCEASSFGTPIAPEQIEGCKSVIPTD
jgi:hypothetical protein